MKKYQAGSTLLEGLISIAIFSFGLLGTMSFQANMLAQSTQTSYRLNASMYASSLLGAADADALNYRCYTYPQPATILSNCTNANAYVALWATRVSEMPGSLTTPPTVVLDGSSNLVVTINWKLPNEAADKPAHTFRSMSRPIGG